MSGKFYSSRHALFNADSRSAFAMLHIALLIVLPALVFSNTLGNEMHLDSVYRVAQNPELEQVRPVLRHFSDPRTSATLPQLAQYRPLLPLSLSINTAVSDALGIDRLTGYHLGNIIIHILVCVMLYLLLRELLRHWSRIDLPTQRLTELAAAVSLLYAVHPVAAVPVNYVCARDLQMMMLFLVASLLVYTRMRRRGETVVGWTAALALLALSLLSKQNSVVMPMLILLFELIVVRTAIGDWRLWARVSGFALVVAGFFVWTEWVLDFSDLDQLKSDKLSPWLYGLTMLRTHVFYYLRNAFWPFEMRALPHIDAAAGPFEPGVLLGVAVVLASIAVALYLWRRMPLAAWSILSYWVLFAPTSSIRPFRYLAADYRQYPSLAFLLLLLVLLLTVVKRRGAAVAAIAAGLLYFGVSTYALNRNWHTEERFWAQSVRYGATPLAHMNYARSIQRRDPALAEHHYLETLRRVPDHVYAHINLGMLYIHSGRADEGLELLRRSVTLAPRWGLTHYWLARAYRMLEQPAEARLVMRRAAELDPRHLDYQYQTARDFQRAGEAAQSLPFLQRIERIYPGYRDAGFMHAYALQQVGDWAAAERKYRQFLARQPQHFQARFNLGHGLMEAGRCREAIAEFLQALEQRPDHRSTHHWLARCYRAIGDEPAASRHAELSGFPVSGSH